jgi:4-diphosphocytidyl-2-C-methyl-D-erythritol kinase
MPARISLQLKAPAKINLFLKILSKRSDGYHEIESLMQKLELADELIISHGKPGIDLNCPDSDLPVNENNLVFKAAKTFFEFTGINPEISLTLKKKIPVAAGLGGGSSDAAAALKGLDTWHETNLPEKALMKLGCSIGADVPFFISENASAVALGIGEKLNPCKIAQDYWLILINPGFEISTKWVYDNYSLTIENNPYILCPDFDITAFKNSNFKNSREIFFNSLEAVTIKYYPEIERIKDVLLYNKASAAMMSGSGPTVFGIFKDKTDAKNCKLSLNKQYKTILLTKPVNN